MLTQEMLRHLWPKAPQSKIDAICATCDDVFAEFGVDDPKVVAQLMANISHENGAGTIVREKMYTHAERMVDIFGAPHSSAALTLVEAEQLVGKPQAFFERVYNVPHSPKLAKELGNCAPGDGYRCRGVGDLQTTGREALTRLGERVDVDLISNPDVLIDPALSFRVAVADFVALKCVGPAKRGQTAVVRRLVNGGNNGLSEVTVLVRKWTEALPGIEAALPAPRGSDASNTSLMGSKIMQGATGTAGAIATAAVSTVAKNANTTTQTVSVSDIADKVQQASDTVTTVTMAKDNLSAIVETAKPLLGIAPNTWAIIAVCALVIAGVCIAFTMWERHKKFRDQGV
jgi:putative chitinase